MTGRRGQASDRATSAGRRAERGARARLPRSGSEDPTRPGIGPSGLLLVVSVSVVALLHAVSDVLVAASLRSEGAPLWASSVFVLTAVLAAATPLVIYRRWSL